MVRAYHLTIISEAPLARASVSNMEHSLIRLERLTERPAVDSSDGLNEAASAAVNR